MAFSVKQTYCVTNRIRKLIRGSSNELTVDLHALNSWNCCGICNHPSRKPVCCPNGDVFCRTCILEYLVEHTKSSNNEKATEDAQKKKVDLFMQTQRVAPKVLPKNEEEPTLVLGTKKKRVKPKCPVCQKKVAYKNFFDIIYQENNEGVPLCCGCEKTMQGIVKAYRAPCGHAICDACVEFFVNVDNQCPKCSQKTKPDDIILLNKHVIDQVVAGGRVILKSPGLIMPYG